MNRPLASIDTDALLVHATDVLTAGAAALRGLFPMHHRPPRDHRDVLRLSWNAAQNDGYDASVSWTDLWPAVTQRAQELWSVDVVTFLCADRALSVAARARQLQNDLVEEVTAHVSAAIRDHIRLAEHERLDRDWRAAPHGSAAESKAAAQIKKIRTQWRNGDIDLTAGAFDDALLEALRRAQKRTLVHTEALALRIAHATTALPEVEVAPVAAPLRARADGAPAEPVPTVAAPAAFTPRR